MTTFNDISSTLKPVADYYSGKSLFITGGTGFLGKVLIEKLLYSCEEIDKIYVLVRNKNDQDANKRIDEMLSNTLFTRLKENKADCLKKLVPIIGDIAEPNLGMTPSDEELLIEKVSVVFHSAATVKFNEPLSEAIKVNVEGTRKVLDLCHRMKNIDMLVHISTLYANCDRKVIEEVIYPPPTDLNELYTYMKSDAYDEKSVSHILANRPNTYTFTKALAENLIEKEHGEIPTIIIRPSIVGSVKNEPTPGWLDNWYGATSFFTFVSMGIIRIIPGRGDGVIDLIPVDYVCNLAIVAAAKSVRSNLLHVYNSCTSECNPINMKKLTDLILSNNNFLNTSIHFTTSRKIMKVLSFVLEYIPAYFKDIYLWMAGQKQRVVKLHSRVNHQREKLEYFGFNNWQAKYNNSKSLVDSLSETDIQTFRCDSTDIKWNEYIPIYLMGARKYVMEKLNE
ncbi:putative fatty acyl-CoA reductase CG5065 [Achroia grisella]|uniref:putative fatty acyl-CoA reductase CG5065 n=1 Tax=Achroia grisella TaxID=688607 RepID=UPI0027D33FD8|nr:putative fatty acyl-CoA reductase CG5065 [Achroia grisella]